MRRLDAYVLGNSANRKDFVNYLKTNGFEYDGAGTKGVYVEGKTKSLGWIVTDSPWSIFILNGLKSGADKTTREAGSKLKRLAEGYQVSSKQKG
jgi:hypothetical protein